MFILILFIIIIEIEIWQMIQHLPHDTEHWRRDQSWPEYTGVPPPTTDPISWADYHHNKKQSNNCHHYHLFTGRAAVVEFDLQLFLFAVDAGTKHTGNTGWDNENQFIFPSKFLLWTNNTRQCARVFQEEPADIICFKTIAELG